MAQAEVLDDVVTLDPAACTPLAPSERYPHGAVRTRDGNVIDARRVVFVRDPVTPEQPPGK